MEDFLAFFLFDIDINITLQQKCIIILQSTFGSYNIIFKFTYKITLIQNYKTIHLKKKKN